MVIHLIVGLLKNVFLCKMRYFAEPYTCSKSKVKVILNLSNYVTKSDLKIAKDVDASKFAKKADLTSLKSDIDKLHIDKLQKAPSVLNS